MKVKTLATDYEGRWPARGFFRTWIYDWPTWRPYVIWTAVGIVAEVCLVIGYHIGLHAR